MSAGAVASLSNWGRGAFKQRRQRCASRLLAIEFLARCANHAGQVVGYARRAIGPELGVDERQAFNILQDLARQGLITIEARFTKGGRQIANCYRWLAPQFLAQIEGEERAAELPPPEPEPRIHLTWMEVHQRQLAKELADPP